jgi:uncharacterized membrane protein
MSTTPLLQLLTVLAVLLLLDAAWLTAISPTVRALWASIQGSPLQIRWIPAAVVYALLAPAVWYFAVLPATSTLTAAARGAALGLTAYGVYDMTLYATVTKYPLGMALSDMAWGAFLCAAAAAAGYAVNPTTAALTRE